MPGFLKDSRMFNLIMAFVRRTEAVYATSRLRVFVEALVRYTGDSLLYRLMRKYFNKPYYFEYSFTLRAINGIVALLDVPISLIGRLLRYLTGGSRLRETGEALKKASTEDIFKVTGVIGVFVALGYGAGLLLKGAAAAEFVNVWQLLVVSLVFVALGYRFNYVRGSLIYRFFSWLVKA